MRPFIDAFILKSFAISIIEKFMVKRFKFPMHQPRNNNVNIMDLLFRSPDFTLGFWLSVIFIPLFSFIYAYGIRNTCHCAYKIEGVCILRMSFSDFERQ